MANRKNLKCIITFPSVSGVVGWLDVPQLPLILPTISPKTAFNYAPKLNLIVHNRVEMLKYINFWGFHFSDPPIRFMKHILFQIPPSPVYPLSVKTNDYLQTIIHG